MVHIDPAMRLEAQKYSENRTWPNTSPKVHSLKPFNGTDSIRHFNRFLSLLETLLPWDVMGHWSS